LFPADAPFALPVPVLIVPEAGVAVFTAVAGVLLDVVWALLAALDGVGLAVDVPLLLVDPGVGVGVGDAAFWPPELELLAPGFCAVAIIAMAVASARI
jgi:hypothetical protein